MTAEDVAMYFSEPGRLAEGALQGHHGGEPQDTSSLGKSWSLGTSNPESWILFLY